MESARSRRDVCHLVRLLMQNLYAPLGGEGLCLNRSFYGSCRHREFGFQSAPHVLPFSFLQIPPRDGHPCRSANCSTYRVNSVLSPPSHSTATTRIETAPSTALRAILGAPKKTRANARV